MQWAWWLWLPGARVCSKRCRIYTTLMPQRVHHNTREHATASPTTAVLHICATTCQSFPKVHPSIHTSIIRNTSLLPISFWTFLKWRLAVVEEKIRARGDAVVDEEHRTCFCYYPYAAEGFDIIVPSCDINELLRWWRRRGQGTTACQSKGKYYLFFPVVLSIGNEDAV